MGFGVQGGDDRERGSGVVMMGAGVQGGAQENSVLGQQKINMTVNRLKTASLTLPRRSTHAPSVPEWLCRHRERDALLFLLWFGLG